MATENIWECSHAEQPVNRLSVGWFFSSWSSQTLWLALVFSITSLPSGWVSGTCVLQPFLPGCLGFENLQQDLL